MDKQELDFLKGLVQKELLRGKKHSKIRLIIEKYAPFAKFDFKIYFVDLEWIKKKSHKQLFKPMRSYTEVIVIDLILTGYVDYENKIDLSQKKIDFSDRFECRILLDRKNDLVDFELFDQEQMILEKFISHTIQKQKELSLKNLDDQSLCTNNRSVFGNFIEITRKPRQNQFPKVFKDAEVFYDLVRTSQDFNLKIGYLHAFKPYIQNIIDSKLEFGDDFVFRYHPTVFDKWYLMNAGLLFELFYNFWDKIGDLLDNCFGIIPQGKNVYFGTVIHKFPNSYKSSPHYKWLLNFKDSDFKTLIGKRNNVVHYTAVESQIHNDFLKMLDDENKIRLLQSEIYSFVTYFLEHARLALEGFVHTVKLIDEIP